MFVRDPHLDGMFDVQRYLDFVDEFPQCLPEVLRGGDESEADERINTHGIHCSRCGSEVPADFASVVTDSNRTQRWLDQCNTCYRLTRLLTVCTFPN